MVKNILDYLILVQLIISILFVIISHNKYEYIVLYFSFVIFLGYWLIKGVFNKEAYN